MTVSHLLNPSRRRFLGWLISLSGVSVACTQKAPAQEVTPPGSVEPFSSMTNSALALPATALSEAQATNLAPTFAVTAPLQTTITPQITTSPPEIVQPAVPNQASFSQYAFEMRQVAVESGDQAYGAILVKDNQVVGLGPSRVIVNHDATCHAEMEAIRDASRRLGTADLSGCELYSTSRPCRMCEVASYWAGVERMYYGLEVTDGGEPQYDRC